MSDSAEAAAILVAADAPHLAQASSYDEIAQIQTEAIRKAAARIGRPLSILEAGCGRSWNLDLAGIEFTLTGVDLDPLAIELRKDKRRDLDVAIVGDLCRVDLPESSFDVVFSSFVLEHILEADVALNNMIKWLRPMGTLILRVPDRNSSRAFFTRLLPHAAHLWYYRHILGSKDAGKPGHAPYPTYFHPVIGRIRLQKFLADRHVRLLSVYGDGFRRDGRGMGRILIRGLMKLASMLSFGYLTADHCDVLFIAIKAF